jgi:hypothetical protein
MTDEDKTPAQTPAAKKSSGAWRLNLSSVLCARRECLHRRDEHRVDENGRARECLSCRECLQFVIGGDDGDAV